MKHLTLMAASVAMLSMPSIANAGWGHQAAPAPSIYNYENCLPKVQPCTPAPVPCQPRVQRCKPKVYIHCKDPVFNYETSGGWVSGVPQGCLPPPPPPPPPVQCCAPPPPPPPPPPPQTGCCAPTVGSCGTPKPTGIYYYCGSNKRYDAYGRRIR